MKIKILNGLLIIDILAIVLILAVVFVPSSTIRVILGLPFILFFPGYSLLSALLINREKMEVLELIALSCGVSLAIVAFIGFGLNFTSQGIRVEPLLFSLAVFIALTSTVAFIRGARLVTAAKFSLKPGFKFSSGGGGTFHSALSISLLVAILGAVGVLGYNLATVNTSEKFTEFYILGISGRAQDYPVDFILENGQVNSVRYGDDVNYTVSGWGSVTLGIVNHERELSNYSVKIKIDGEFVKIYHDGMVMEEMGQIGLASGEKWEQNIGFAPRHTGSGQRVEFLLFNNNAADPLDTLQLQVNVE